MKNTHHESSALVAISSSASILLFAWQPFPGEYRVGVFALIIIGIYRLLIKEPNIHQPIFTRLLQLLACSAIPAIASIGLSVNKSSTIEGIGAIIVSIFVGIGMLTGLENSKGRLMQQQGITILVATWVLIAFVYSAVSFGLHGSIKTINPSLSLLTSSRFGRLLTMLMPVALWRPIRERSIGAFGVLIGAGVATVLTGQRNNILSYLIGACLLLSQLPKKLALRLLAGVIVVIFCTYPLSPELRTRTQQLMSGLSTEVPSQQSSAFEHKQEMKLIDRLNLISSDRGFIFEAAIKMMRSNPITGTGAFTFKDAYPRFADRKDEKRFKAPPGPHSIYLGILAQTGVVGFAGLLTSVILLIKWHISCRVSKYNTKESDPYAASLAVMLFPLITQNDFYNSFFSITFLYMCCGVITASFMPNYESDHQKSA